VAGVGGSREGDGSGAEVGWRRSAALRRELRGIDLEGISWTEIFSFCLFLL
jgi:hypothetical protein